MKAEDSITPDEVRNLSRLFLERVSRCPDKVAYQYFDNASNQWCDITWQTMADHVGKWQNTLRQENLGPGDRIAIMMKNSPEWVMCEQAALGLGLVVVPLYINDRTENTSHIINDAEVKIIFIDGLLQFKILQPALDSMPSLKSIISIQGAREFQHPLAQSLNDWLIHDDVAPAMLELDKHSLSSIVYTSGTTGKPKGVMLSHGNILWNAYSSSLCFPFKTTDSYLSFLPLSHMFERTVGYYMAMLTGASVAYARSIDQLGEDLLDRKPSILVTVPRIFERVYNKINIQLSNKSPLARKLFDLTVDIGWKKFLFSQKKGPWAASLLLWPILNFLVARKIMSKLGGKMRVAISGGAPLSFDIAKIFTGLGLTISQGYGMTELSPVVCTNRVDDNEVASVGQALPDVNVKLGNDNELLARSPGVMLGYWHNETATKEIIDADGWLHTGDKAKIEAEHIYITGRLKEIIVLSNGEKVPPSDIELAIATDPLFEQVMIIGEGKPYLSALVVLNKLQLGQLCSDLSLQNDTDPNSEAIINNLMQRVKNRLSTFPGYAKIYRIHAGLEPWTIENALITPTLKLKRQPILDKYKNVIEEFYSGH